MEDLELLASEISDKTPADVSEYYLVFQEKGIHSQVSLTIFGFHNSINLFNSYYAEYDRIAQRIAEGEAKRNKQDAL